MKPPLPSQTILVQMDIVADNRADGGAFTDSWHNEIGRVKRRYGLWACRAAEVMQADDVLFCGGVVDDRLGPDAMLVEAPGYREARRPVDSFVGKCNAVSFYPMPGGAA